MKKILLLLSISTFILFTQYSCIDKDFSEPEFPTPNVDFGSTHTIKELKALCTSNYKIITEDIVIEGEVISEDLTGNFYKSFVIQDTKDGGISGITVKLETTGLYNNYPIGQKVFIKCKGLTLGKYGDEVQLGGAEFTNKEKKRQELAGIAKVLINDYIFLDGKPGTPKIKEVSAISSLTDDDKFTLIKFTKVQFESTFRGITWGDNPENTFPFKSTTIEDVDGTKMTVFTSNYSKFGQTLTPTGSGTLMGVLSAYRGDYQFVVRNLDDVDMEGANFTTSGGTPVSDGEANTTPLATINVDFDDQATKKDLNIAGWYNYTEKGTRKWQGKHFNDDKYAQATSYGGDDAELVTWLITQAVDLSTQKILTLKTAMGFWSHDANEQPLEVLVSTNFDGKDVASATWTKLNGNFANSSSSEHAWIESGNINLPIAPKGFIAFKYSATKTKTTNIRLDDIKVQ